MQEMMDAQRSTSLTTELTGCWLLAVSTVNTDCRVKFTWKDSTLLEGLPLLTGHKIALLYMCRVIPRTMSANKAAETLSNRFESTASSLEPSFWSRISPIH